MKALIGAFALVMQLLRLSCCQSSQHVLNRAHIPLWADIPGVKEGVTTAVVDGQNNLNVRALITPQHDSTPPYVFVNTLRNESPPSAARFIEIHPFAWWGKILRSDVEKMIFLEGFTNGLFKGPRSPSYLLLMDCMKKASDEQLIAMIDKFYGEHPEQWNVPIGNAILSALGVKDGPCEGKIPD